MYNSFKISHKLLIFALLVMLGTPLLAGDPSGTWTSSSGSTINLWANMQTVIVTVTTPQGQSFKYNGWWTRFSDNFAYNTNQGTNHASFVNSNQINVKSADGSFFTWTRGVAQRPNPPQQNYQSGISGNWRSSSGAMVQITTNGNQISVAIIGSQGGRSNGIGTWIQPGYRFDYSIAGYQGVAQCTVVSPNQISVFYNGTQTTWTR